MKEAFEKQASVPICLWISSKCSARLSAANYITTAWRERLKKKKKASSIYYKTLIGFKE